ncbi:DUF2332 domain-containing protein [Arachnia propionica]|uniref:DUF2332 domain-containing protein n=1 Tax=Arachnia propionica TaxID=1750 RepID=UPI00163A5118|nr:DUF2332 domain-containing protein [Arachnia propionica]
MTRRQGIRELYETFARETAPTSPLWERVCLWVTRSPRICTVLERLPEDKQQPNLFLAALKYLGLHGTFDDGDDWYFEAVVEDRWEEIRQLILTRCTQTNEAGRCTVLAPILASLPQPVHLVELGASAGLTLQPDRYHYDLGDGVVPGSRADEGAPVLATTMTGLAPASPERLVIGERLGVDARPVHLGKDDLAWLRALVWPGEEDREEQLVLAAGVQRQHPARILQGVLPEAFVWLDREIRAWAELPGSVVVMHSAFAMYLDRAQRMELTRHLADLGVHHLSFEGPRIMPGISAPRPSRPHFVAALDGRALAVASPHGRWVDWL